MHKDDVEFVIKSPTGQWLSVKTRDGRSLAAGKDGAEILDIQRTVEGRGGLAPETPNGTAQNPQGAPPPSGEFPWIPLPKKRRRK